MIARAQLARWLPVVIAAAAVIVPWLPIALHLESLGVRVVLATATILAVFHGFGSLIGLLTSNGEASLALRIVWGMAGYVLVAGVVLALRALDTGAVRAIVIAGLALHTIAGLIRVAGLVLADPPARPTARDWTWLMPAAMFVGIAMLHTLASAGWAPATWFDDDGHVLGQLTRLGQTGFFADAVGNAREAQLGGQLTLDALASITGDLRTARMVDGGVGLIVVLALVWSYVRPRSTHAMVWTTLIGLMVSGLRLVSPDPSSFWTAIAFVLGAYVTLARPRVGLPWTEAARVAPAVLLGAALITLRHELAPAGLVIALAAAWSIRREGYRPHADWLRQAALAVIVVAPYVIARAMDRATVPADVADVLARTSPTVLSPARILAGLACIVVLPLLIAGTRDRRPGRPLVAVAAVVVATLGGLVSGALDGAAYGWRFMFPMVFAWALAVLVEMARGGPPPLTDEHDRPSDAPFTFHRAAYVLALVIVCMSIVGARQGANRWWSRYERMFDDAEQLLHVRTTPAPTAEAALLATLPPGSRVALWVEHPDRLDYRRHVLVDLRTRRLEKIARQHEWLEALPNQFERVLTSLHVDYLLVSEDNAQMRRSLKSYMTRALCRPDESVAGEDPFRSRLPICLDALEHVAATHRMVARDGGVRLVDLRQREYVLVSAY